MQLQIRRYSPLRSHRCFKSQYLAYLPSYLPPFWMCHFHAFGRICPRICALFGCICPQIWSPGLLHISLIQLSAIWAYFAIQQFPSTKHAMPASCEYTRVAFSTHIGSSTLLRLHIRVLNYSIKNSHTPVVGIKPRITQGNGQCPEARIGNYPRACARDAPSPPIYLAELSCPFTRLPLRLFSSAAAKMFFLIFFNTFSFFPLAMYRLVFRSYLLSFLALS